MTQEEKQLLFKDLCTRLPYGVKVFVDIDEDFDESGSIGILTRIEPYVGEKYPNYKGQYLLYPKGFLTPLLIDEVRPYLRPMSSMTKEEAIEMFDTVSKSGIVIGYEIENDQVRYICADDGRFAGHVLIRFDSICTLEQLDWLNAHHFDYRGLIPKGLALEAPEGMYKTE